MHVSINTHIYIYRYLLKYYRGYFVVKKQSNGEAISLDHQATSYIQNTNVESTDKYIPLMKRIN